MPDSHQNKKLGLIAGNGRFPLLALEEARRRSLEVVVAAVREETFPEIEQFAGPHVKIEWLGLGQLGRLIRLFQREGVSQAVLAGQVKHNRIFAAGARQPLKLLSSLPDLKMLRLVASLPERNTAALLGKVIEAIEQEGIQILDSTFLLKHLLAPPGLFTSRGPTPEEEKDVEFGRRVAREIIRLDMGQTLVVKKQAVVAVEAMEGTDETVRRAARLAHGEPLTVIKVSRPGQDMRFDVPVIGMTTLDVFQECSVSALAVDAGKTLILDRAAFKERADELHLCITAQAVSDCGDEEEDG